MAALIIEPRTPLPRPDRSTTAPRQRKWRPWFIAFAAAVVLAAGLGYLTDDHVSEDQRYNRLHVSLDSSHHHANSEATNLLYLRHVVTALRSQVGADAATWSQDTAELRSASAALMVTQADIAQQTSRIGSLHTCLGGVQQALNALAINQQADAISSLDTVSASCSAATGA